MNARRLIEETDIRTNLGSCLVAVHRTPQTGAQKLTMVFIALKKCTSGYPVWWVLKEKEVPVKYSADYVVSYVHHMFRPRLAKSGLSTCSFG